ncbi:MAG: hypothetical protein V7727_04755 [Sneathiella sp.]
MKNTFNFYALAVKLIAIAGLGLLLSACAVGNQYDYKSQPIKVGLDTEQKVAVAVVDQRPYIVSGDKTPNFVGLQRGGFNNPFDVTTLSNEPLADSISSAIVASLKHKNIDAEVLKTKASSDISETLKTLDVSEFTRLLLIHFSEWKSDTLVNVKFTYTIGAKVTDNNLAILAENSLLDKKVLGGSFVNAPEFARTNVPVAFQKVIEELLNDPKIIDALK